MTTNQTIDGVPLALRALLERIVAEPSDVDAQVSRQAAVDELRALLDAPAKPVIRISLELLNTACNGFVQEQGHAINELREILSAHKADQNVKSTSVILDSTNSGNSSNWDSNICIKPVAAQPQGEPVAWIKPDVAKTLRKDECCYAFGSQNPKGTLIPLYAEQPAPVAVVLPERQEVDKYGEFYDSGWNACLDDLKRLNPSL